MLPVRQWPRFLWRCWLVLAMPQRTAIDALRRVDRQWEINRGLYVQLEAEREANRDSERKWLDTLKRGDGNFQEQSRELDGVRRELAEMARAKELVDGELEVKNRQIECDQVIIERFVKVEEARARAAALRGRKPGD